MEENMDNNLECIKLNKLGDTIRKHSPAILTVIGAAATVMQAMMGSRIGPEIFMRMYRTTGDEYYRIRYYQMTKSNNWLRMHGYPMKRKIRH